MKTTIFTIITVLGLILNLSNPTLAQKNEANLDFSVQLQGTNNYDVILYPNPTTNFMFKIKSNQIIAAVEVVNVIGQSVYKSENKRSVDTDLFVQLNECDKGMYLVKIKFDGDKTIIKKLLVK